MTVALVNCVVVDGTGAEPLEDAAIVVDRERIVAVGPSASVVPNSTERVIDLQSRGFEHAGLYDPPGVSGTHVMYVLHHADKPSIYAGLPDKPKISPFVTAWKGLFKPVALAGIAAAAVAGFLHWIVAGPNEVQPEDEAEEGGGADVAVGCVALDGPGSAGPDSRLVSRLRDAFSDFRSQLVSGFLLADQTLKKFCEDLQAIRESLTKALDELHR